MENKGEVGGRESGKTKKMRESNGGGKTSIEPVKEKHKKGGGKKPNAIISAL